MVLDIVLDMLLLEDDEVTFLGGRLWFAGGKHWVHSWRSPMLFTPSRLRRRYALA